MESSVRIGRDEFFIITECATGKPAVTTRVYRGGELLKTRTADHGHIGPEKLDIHELMRIQHDMCTRVLKQEMGALLKHAADYVQEIKELMKKNSFRAAREIASEALSIFPDDLYLRSFYGFLIAKADKRNREGLDLCLKAINTLKSRAPFGAEFFYPVLYLNLGRTYALAGKKWEAINSFSKGLSVEKDNREILWEIKKLGVRRKPPLPFLDRGNALNKYLGILRSYFIK